jgi:hypothetical protein
MTRAVVIRAAGDSALALALMDGMTRGDTERLRDEVDLMRFARGQNYRHMIDEARQKYSRPPRRWWECWADRLATAWAVAWVLVRMALAKMIVRED